MEQKPPAEQKISIIVLTYNALEYTKKCLASIHKNTKLPYELVIVDNCSSDGTREWLKKEYFDDEVAAGIVSVWLPEENLGVAGGRNFGIKQTTSDIIIYLDNDTEVSKGWDTLMVHHLKSHYRVGIVGKSGVDVRCLDPITWETVYMVNGQAEVDAVSGFCFGFKRELLDLIGENYTGFPNNRFWHEDLDFCLRAKKAGFKVIADSKIPILHHEHKSMGDEKGDIHKPENQEGFQANATCVKERLSDKNLLTIYADYRGSSDMSAFGRGVMGLTEALRDLDVTVVRKPAVRGKNRGFELCKMFEAEYDGKKIVSIFQENDAIPMSWIEELKKYDEIFVNSPHALSAICKTLDTKEENWEGVPKMHASATVGIDTDIYNPEGDIYEDLHPDKFKFLVVGASQPRKGFDLLVKAYYEEFKGRDDVVLIIKDGGYGKMFDTTLLVENYKAKEGCPPIEYIFGQLKDEDMAKLYRSCAANGIYVHPHRAECFGMTLLEAAACGCQIVTSGYGGPISNLDDLKGVRFIKGTMELSTFHNHKGEPFYEKDEYPRWFAPDMADLKQHMRISVERKKIVDTWVHDNYETIKHKFSYPVLAAKFLKILS
jgi:glycosyltransferase involved in cell wall biosynthesis